MKRSYNKQQLFVLITKTFRVLYRPLEFSENSAATLYGLSEDFILSALTEKFLDSRKELYFVLNLSALFLSIQQHSKP